mgnify:FL=1
MFWSIFTWLVAWLSSAVIFIGSLIGWVVLYAIWRGWIPCNLDNDKRGNAS